MRSRGWLAALVALCAAGAAQAAPSVPPDVAKVAALPKLRGPVPLFFLERPVVDRSGRAPARKEAPVVVRFRHDVGHADLKALRDAGAHRLRRHGRLAAARATPDALSRMALLPQVAAIEADGSPFGSLRPLDTTTAEITASHTWLRGDGDDVALTGHGITVCDIDSGIDVFHPLFFRADGGYFSWHDVDGDGRLTHGVDTVDSNGDGTPEPLGVVEGLVFAPGGNAPVFGSEDPSFRADIDWLWADTNNDGIRDRGRGAGFDDHTPTFGEQLFVVDDVDGDRRLDVGEKLIALGGSKIKAVSADGVVYRRGENLIDAPLGDLPSHGTAASSVMMGGARGVTRFAGVAPDAELVMGIRTVGDDELAALTMFCIVEGARVVLHEYAPWQGYSLDGSSALEELIDATSRGESVAQGAVAHINPAGNLSTADKLYKRSLPAGQTTVIDITVPDDAEYKYFGASVLWRDARDLSLTLVDATGATRQLQQAPGQRVEPWHDGLLLFTQREVSSRGTTRVDAIIVGNDFEVPLDQGAWEIRVADATAPGGDPVEVIAYVQDDISGWGKGIHFPEHVSEDHLIGHPGTADTAIAVAAYDFTAYRGGEPGERAFYSGRGYRIDGEEILSVSAPADPISASWAPPEVSPGFSYVTFGGTSGSSPHVAGAAALILQHDPAKDGEGVRAAIRTGALADEAVGAAPNRDFGWGKLRVYQSVFGSEPPPAGMPSITVLTRDVSVGEHAVMRVLASDPDQTSGSLRIELDRQYDGTYEELVEDGSFEVRFDEPGSATYKLQVTDDTGRTSATLATIRARPRASLAPAGGNGCSTVPKRGTGQGWLWLWVAASIALWRRPCPSASRSTESSSTRS